MRGGRNREHWAGQRGRRRRQRHHLLGVRAMSSAITWRCGAIARALVVSALGPRQAWGCSVTADCPGGQLCAGGICATPTPTIFITFTPTLTATPSATRTITPTAEPSVDLTFTFSFAPDALGETYTVEAAGTDDSGDAQDFEDVGTITIAAALPCAGDCDGDGAVRVNELLIGVNIALDPAAFGLCPSFDANGDASVEVGELVAAVNEALTGCPK